MRHNGEPQDHARAWGLRVGSGVLGLALAGLLVEEGVRSGATSAVWPGSGPLLALLAGAMVITSQRAAVVRRRYVLFTLVPITAGMSTLTWLLGWTSFPGQLLWWVPGALISATPLWVMGMLRDAPRTAVQRVG